MCPSKRPILTITLPIIVSELGIGAKYLFSENLEHNRRKSLPIKPLAGDSQVQDFLKILQVGRVHI